MMISPQWGILPWEYSPSRLFRNSSTHLFSIWAGPSHRRNQPEQHQQPSWYSTCVSLFKSCWTCLFKRLLQFLRAAAGPLLGIILLWEVKLIKDVLAQLLLTATEKLRHNRVITSLLLQHNILQRRTASLAQLRQTPHQLREVLDSGHFRWAGESLKLRESLEIENKDEVGVGESYHYVKVALLSYPLFTITTDSRSATYLSFHSIRLQPMAIDLP